MEKINVVFLGTSDQIPSKERNHTSILVSYKNENILVDCGEGTQRQFRKAELNPMRLTRILITHWHGDHVLGIPGLLQTLASSGYDKTLFIYGPKGTKKFFGEMLNAFGFVGKFKIEVKEVEGKFLETKDFYLEAKKLYHGIPCNAYSFIERGKLRLDRKKLSKLKLKNGPHMAKLKEGKDIVLDGKKYKAKELSYYEEGRKISFVLDTSFDKSIATFVKNSDLFICESSYGDELKEKAKEHKHLTVGQAALISKQGKVKKLILTHISQRYEKNLENMLEHSKKVFKNSHLAKDLDSFEV